MLCYNQKTQDVGKNEVQTQYIRGYLKRKGKQDAQITISNEQ